MARICFEKLAEGWAGADYTWQPPDIQGGIVDRHISLGPALATMSSLQIPTRPKVRGMNALSIAGQIDGQDNDRGIVSTKALMRGAVHAGLGAAAGQVMGVLLGASPQTRSKMRRIGLLGNLLYQSGVLGE